MNSVRPEISFKVLTLFPGMFTGPFDHSLIKKARDNQTIALDIINIRDYAESKHQTVDDTPFGGGQGMLMMPGPVVSAIEAHSLAGDTKQEIILVTPQGKPFTQKDAVRLSSKQSIVFVCGHYEGFDERVREYVHSEYSIGDYVLTGGELPAMVMIDSIARLVPGVIKEQDSFLEDSFYDGLLEHPHYTKPREFRGKEVPEVLLSGHHKNIREWRLKESLRRTYLRRPDLLEKRNLTKQEARMLEEICDEER